MSYVTMNDLACCGLPGLGQAPAATITAATVNESGVEKLRRRLCEPAAIFAMAGGTAGVGLWLIKKAKKRNDERKQPSITDLLKQTYDRQHSIRGGQAK